MHDKFSKEEFTQHAQSGVELAQHIKAAASECGDSELAEMAARLERLRTEQLKSMVGVELLDASR